MCNVCRPPGGDHDLSGAATPAGTSGDADASWCPPPLLEDRGQVCRPWLRDVPCRAVTSAEAAAGRGGFGADADRIDRDTVVVAWLTASASVVSLLPTRCRRYSSSMLRDAVVAGLAAAVSAVVEGVSPSWCSGSDRRSPTSPPWSSVGVSGVSVTRRR